MRNSQLWKTASTDGCAQLSRAQLRPCDKHVASLLTRRAATAPQFVIVIVAVGLLISFLLAPMFYSTPAATISVADANQLMAPPSLKDSTATPATEPEVAPPRYPARVSRFDIATREELLYAHWVAPLVKSDDVSTWAWVRDFVNTTGKWIALYVDTNKIATAIHHGMAIDGQLPMAPLDAMVDDCARILQVKKPKVVIRNSPETRAYTLEVDSEVLLVMTSGMIKLYNHADEELRFVIGRELGHIKCEHLRIRKASYGVLKVLSTISEATVPPEAKEVLTNVLMGRMIQWAQESEISADRAGLICCGRPQTAFNAIARQLHGLDKTATILDPKHPDIDAEKIVDQFRRWENEPVWQLLNYLRHQSPESPFIAERLVALKRYSESDLYRNLLDRSTKEPAPFLAMIDQIQVQGVAGSESGIYPQVICLAEDRRLFQTPVQKWGTKATWTDIDTQVSESSGAPLFFELYNCGYTSKVLVGGFVIYPDAGDGTKDPSAEYTAQILWNWRDRSSEARTGTARVRLHYSNTGTKQ